MRIALVNPDSPGLIDPKVFPPLGILYVSAILKQHGHDVEVIDLAGKGAKTLPKFKKTPDIVGISSTTPQFPLAVYMLQYLKESGLKTIIGGPHATTDPESCRKAGFDYVWHGEAEETLDNPFGLVDLIDNIFDLETDISVKQLDEIPFPDRDVIDLSSYRYSLDGKKCTSIISSRGCPYSCAFCCKSWGRHIRYRSAKNVIKESKHLKEEYGYEALMFYDDEMLINKRRDFEIFYNLKLLDITYRIFSRIDLVKELDTELLRITGCKQICFGIESGSDRILKNIHKGITINQAKKVIKWCKEQKLSVKTFMIVGLPGESKDSLRETATFLSEVQPDDVDFTVLTVYPGSDIYNHPEKYDLKWKYEPNWYKTGPGKYVTNVSTSHLTSEEIIEARDCLEERFKKW